MQPQNLLNTIEAISEPRLNTYRRFFDTKTDHEAYGLYCWNETLAAELFKLVSNIEITMRNRYHTALSAYYFRTAKGTQQSNDWFNHIGITHENAKNTISKHRRHKYPDKTIAALNYGFWMHLYDCHTDLAGHQVDWGNIFPNIVIGHRYKNYSYWNRMPNRDALYGRVLAVNKLRNRIAHHEPIWKFGPLMEEKRGRPKVSVDQLRPAPKSVPDMLQRLNDIHSKGIELLSWFSPSRADDYMRSQTYYEFKRLATIAAIEAYKNIPTKQKYQLSDFRKQMNRIMRNREAVQIHQKGEFKGTFFPF